MFIRLAHLSDVHFGRLASPQVVQALVKTINEQAFDLVVVSGDLTQRARTSQFKAAARMLAAFEAPVMVVPGNHDVPAWYRPLARIFWPMRRFEHFISPEFTPTFESPGLAVVGINTAHGWTIKGGRVRASHIAFMQAFFDRQPPNTFKVLVMHHHLVRLVALGKHDVARQARLALEGVGEQNVDLVLCGHLHRSHVESVSVSEGAHRVVVASAGTATSSRGRESGPDRRANFFNMIHVEPDRFVIEEHRFDKTGAQFRMYREAPFSRADVVPRDPSGVV